MTIKTNSKADLKKMIEILIEGYNEKERMPLLKIAKSLQELSDFYKEVYELSEFCKTQYDGDEIIGHRD